jgi:hypothetical protein
MIGDIPRRLDVKPAEGADHLIRALAAVAIGCSMEAKIIRDGRIESRSLLRANGVEADASLGPFNRARRP